MAVTLNETPGSSHLHIEYLEKQTAESALINAFTGQEVSIVANVAGTTTDPVYEAMEVHPLGPCIIIDTAGFGDESELGKSRMEKTRLAAEKTDIALLLVAGNGDAALDEEEMHWYRFLKEHGTPVLFVVGKTDIRSDAQVDKLAAAIREKTGEEAYPSAPRREEGMEALKEALIRKTAGESRQPPHHRDTGQPGGEAGASRDAAGHPGTRGKADSAAGADFARTSR